MPNHRDEISKEDDEINPQLLAEKDELILRQQQQIALLKNLLNEEISNKQTFARALSLQNSKNEELINSVPWIVLLISKDLVYCDVNRYYASLFELSTHDFVDKIIGSQDEDECLVKAIQEFNNQDTNQIVRKEIYLSSRHINRHYLLIMYRNIMSDQISAVGIDITERVRTEQELVVTKKLAIQHAEELAETLIETNQLMREAQLANRTKSEFLTMISHELRTPLNGVIGMGSLLIDSNLDDEQQENVEIILASAENLLKIITELLDFSKIDSGKVALENVPFSLRELLVSVEHLFSHRAVEKGLDFSINILSDIPPLLLGDPSRLKQVLVNLIHNAIKFTKEGLIEIRVLLQTKDENRHTYHFEIEDTGIGISEAIGNRLFQPFVQADSSISRSYNGTGLGLATSRHLVDSGTDEWRNRSCI